MNKWILFAILFVIAASDTVLSFLGAAGGVCPGGILESVVNFVLEILSIGVALWLALEE